MISTPPGHSPPPAPPPTHCAACGIVLNPGSRFCHRCGAPIQPGSRQTPVSPPPHGAAESARTVSRVPWVIAGLAVAGALAIWFTRRPATETPAIPLAASTSLNGVAPTTAPNIADLTPSERASRLYVRVMEYAEAGKTDSVSTFAPMVIAAHQMLTEPSVDERYHFGRVAEVVGAKEITTAQADTILAADSTSLLGLLLASRAARLRGDDVAAGRFDRRLLANLSAQLATQNVDYDNHRAEIDRAVEEARRNR